MQGEKQVADIHSLAVGTLSPDLLFACLYELTLPSFDHFLYLDELLHCSYLVTLALSIDVQEVITSAVLKRPSLRRPPSRATVSHVISLGLPRLIDYTFSRLLESAAFVLVATRFGFPLFLAPSLEISLVTVDPLTAVFTAQFLTFSICLA